MLTPEQKVLLEVGYAGRIKGIVEVEGIHRCPVCGEVGECLSTGDNFHSCRWCCSTWQSVKGFGSSEENGADTQSKGCSHE